MLHQQGEEEAQSVSSEPSDEDYCDEEQEGEAERSSFQPQDHLQVDNPQALESPAPAVVLGGENEFVKVSHLGSIEVKEVAKKQPSEIQRVLPLGKNHRRTSSGSDSHETSEAAAEREDSPMERPSTATSASDSSGPMEHIEKSPYEADYHAEKGEKIFDEMNEALEEDKHSFGKPTLRAVEMFGNKDANRIVRAKPIIDKSGIVFSQGWADGNFRGIIVGKIPPDQLVLCLCPNRFVKASDLELSGICRDLKLYTLITEAIDKWELEDDFKLVRECTKNYAFTAKKRDSFKCAIFVARLYSCFKNSGRTKLNSRLMNKAKACLTIMEQHMPENGSPNKKKKKVVDHEASSRSSSPSTIPGYPAAAGAAEPASQQPDPSKRKRGRPPKNSRLSPPRASPISSSTTPAVSENKKRRVNKEMETPAKTDKITCARVRQESSSAVEENSEALPSMQRLISRFEEKYEELGEVLQQIKAAARRPQQRTEAQIRADVLEEVQKSVMKSFPKK